MSRVPTAVTDTTAGLARRVASTIAPERSPSAACEGVRPPARDREALRLVRAPKHDDRDDEKRDAEPEEDSENDGNETLPFAFEKSHSGFSGPGPAPGAGYFFVTFSQSARKLLTPASVSGCLMSCSSTLNGIVATSAPISADSYTCCGWRMLATMTWVPNE